MCGKCPKRKTCKKLCKKVKAHLRKCKIRSADWIRPRKTGGAEYREIPFSNVLYKEDLERLDEFIGN